MYTIEFSVCLCYSFFWVLFALLLTDSLTLSLFLSLVLFIFAAFSLHVQFVHRARGSSARGEKKVQAQIKEKEGGGGGREESKRHYHQFAVRCVVASNMSLIGSRGEEELFTFFASSRGDLFFCVVFFFFAADCDNGC